VNANQKTSPGSDDAKSEAELEKLHLEIQALQRRSHWADRAIRYIPLATVVITVAGLCFGIYQFGVQQNSARAASIVQQDREFTEREKVREARVQEQEREQKLRERELFKPLWQRQIALYFEASGVAATIATTTNNAKRDAAVERFWQLYQGPLVIVESKGVSGAMVNFGRCLDGSEECLGQELGQRSKALATQVQESLSNSWAQGLGRFSDGKFKYH
jgi:hypothetical protein